MKRSTGSSNETYRGAAVPIAEFGAERSAADDGRQGRGSDLVEPDGAGIFVCVQPHG